MATNEVIGKWFSGQPTRGGEPPPVATSAVKRPNGVLDRQDPSLAGSGKSVEEMIDQVIMSIRMMAEVIMEDRLQDRRMWEEWMGSFQRQQVVRDEQVQKVLALTNAAAAHREEGYMHIESHVSAEFKSHHAWVANQFVILRAAMEGKALQAGNGTATEQSMSEIALHQPGPKQVPKEALKVAKPKKPTKEHQQGPSVGGALDEEGADPEVEASLKRLETRAQLDGAKMREQLGSQPTKSTLGSGDQDPLQGGISNQSLHSQHIEQICGIDWERKKLDKFLARMHNIKGKHSIAERIMTSGKIDKERLSELSQKPHGPMTRFADSFLFACFSTLAIISNSVWIGITTNVSMQNLIYAHQGAPEWHRDVNRVYAVVFAFELVVRLLGYRIYFFISPEWQWNMYDLVVVVTAIMEELLESLNLNVMRAVRVFRVVRVVRIVRLLRFFMRFRHLVCTVLSCGTMLMWTVLFLGFLIYLFAIIFMQGIITFCNRTDEDLLRELGHMYGSVDRAMYTLFQSLTNGRPWREFMDPMARVTWVFIPVFCGYLIFVLFGVLNVLTGVFVGETKELQDRDRDLAMHNEMAAAEAFSQELRILLWDHGMVQDDTISIDVFEHTECEDVEMFLQSHGLDSMDAHELFLLLDTDGTGMMAITDFVYGCQRLKSPAKGMDLVMMYEQVVAVKEKLTEHKDYMRSLGRDIHYLVSRMSKEMAELSDEMAQATAVLQKSDRDQADQRSSARRAQMQQQDVFI